MSIRTKGKNLSASQSAKLAGIALFVILAALQFARLLAHLYQLWGDWRTVDARFAAGICVRVVLIYLVVVVIRSLRFEQFAGFSNSLRVKNPQALMLPLFIIGVGLYSNLSTYVSAPAFSLALFVMSVLLVGFFEELFFRGLILPLLIGVFRKTKHSILIGVIISSLLFGLVHYINLLDQPHNFVGVTSQVLFATAMGFFFCGLFFRTRNLLLTGLVHVFVNFAFSAGILNATEQDFSNSTTSEDLMAWSDLLSSLPVFAFIFAGGAMMLYLTDLEELGQSLNISATSMSE